MVRFFKSSVAYQSAAVAIALVLLTAATIVGAMHFNLKDQVMQDAESDAREATRAMAVLAVMALDGFDIVVKDGELVSASAEAIPPFADHEFVDRTADSIDGVVTMFQTQGSEYVRVSTNLKKEDGSRAMGTKLAPDHPAHAFLAKGEAYYGPAVLFGRSFMTGYFPVKNEAGANVGLLFIGIPMEVYFAKINEMLMLVLGVGAACTAIFGAAAFLANRAMMKPMGVLARAVRRIAGGDISVEAPYQDKKNEYGEIGRALAVFRDNALEKQRIEAESAENRSAADAERSRNDEDKRRIDAEIGAAVDALAGALNGLAQGDLTRHIETPFTGRLEQVRVDFNSSVATLRETLGEVRHNAEAILEGSHEIRNAADEMSKRTERQAASVEETAAAVEEITATVRDSTRRAEEAGALVGRTRTGAEQSGELVQRAVEAMQLIDNSSREISSIIGVIDEIAFQTNLLALNAGVEAARAGDAGKGFAVVASEVRALAQRSADAAKQIKGLIQNSADQVANGVRLVGDTGASLEVIVGEVKEIHAHVNAIVTAAREQSSSLSEVNTAVNTIDQGTQQNAAMAEQSTAASHGLAREATALGDLIARFTLDANRVGGADVVVMTGPLHAAGRAMRQASNDSQPSSISG